MATVQATADKTGIFDKLFKKNEFVLPLNIIFYEQNVRITLRHISGNSNFYAVNWVYEVIIYIITAVVFENEGGNLYGVAVGFDPPLVFVCTLAINLLVVFAASMLVDRFLNWRKGAKAWIERRTARGQRLINKYSWLGIIAGTFVLSPMQTAVVGRMLLIEPRKFYPPLIVGTVLGCFVSMGIALGLFKVILGW